MFVSYMYLLLILHLQILKKTIHRTLEKDVCKFKSKGRFVLMGDSDLLFVMLNCDFVRLTSGFLFVIFNCVLSRSHVVSYVVLDCIVPSS